MSDPSTEDKHFQFPYIGDPNLIKQDRKSSNFQNTLPSVICYIIEPFNPKTFSLHGVKVFLLLHKSWKSAANIIQCDPTCQIAWTVLKGAIMILTKRLRVRKNWAPDGIFTGAVKCVTSSDTFHRLLDPLMSLMPGIHELLVSLNNPTP